MKIRRCAILFVEPREEVSFDLDGLLTGGDGLRRRQRWLALAPHLGHEVEVDDAERELLGALSPSLWVAATAQAEAIDTIECLIGKGLVISDRARDHEARERDEQLRSTYWHPLGAAFNAFTRWSGIDAVQSMKENGIETAVSMREVLGAPPGEALRHPQAGDRVALPRVAPTDFDDLLARRATCRNFDATRPLPQALFAQLMQRVFAAQAEVRVTDDTVFLKKNVPSGGGLHPMECYLIVQHVEGIAPGLYHYQAREHALDPLPGPGRPLRGFVQEMVAQQHWFADAHVVVVLSPRFDRTFWKYRSHAKGYRVVALEAGHLSQTLYLAATDAGLGAFITGAINEVELEQAFGLDPIRQGAMAICGFGWRGAVMEMTELDPAGRVWDRDRD
ncbi:putative peptide maturation dehydrogenase [Lysobacter sp. MMG2]|uniref:putative peptide maturation dehydrogenase n=1 Tax=Lysobacter sp. MMG2 TaxID=2801338 RepID=UPI001C24C821|nr:putative peptide maturation dehydrogenase [Lysobacter sp. MMG2]MBU8977347.1 putative peptide maturation dehydrogenase [Lysobacter sp. MMG2]